MDLTFGILLDEASSWPFIVYFVVALVSTPLYIAIVVKLFINRNNRKFSSTFYTLLLSQGFADIFYIFCYTVFYMLSYVGTIKDIGSFFKWTLANISYKCLYYSLNLRYVGVTLISFQRYLTICKWRSTYIQVRSHILFWRSQWGTWEYTDADIKS
ncbi:hypothetical protein ANCCEY_05324 [Ancylostoma ceylanicum]|uniref:G-protein coupled receptors family 1 profile domain-containing protein n=1 Tax=Ancylostoma ceylanicum TaxID=53326 RepID=A0A0D6LU49_9BILA|nr:hypothetical protein ANCCEY_05324 [Ancylostoma ceylanicum]